MLEKAGPESVRDNSSAGRSGFPASFWITINNFQEKNRRNTMRQTYPKYWWLFISRGIIAILFGLAAILLPGITLELLVLLVGAFFFADGVLALVGSFGTRRVEEHWWVSLLEGITGILIGILAIIWPGTTLVAIVFLIAAWAFMTGVFEIVAAIRLRKVVIGEWFLGLGGIISVLFGLFLFVSPGTGAVTLVWILGAYAIFFGILLLLLGFKLKKFLQSGQIEER
jgi:uncharacterized membrane protein HdeD (DUF308 family)